MGRGSDAEPDRLRTVDLGAAVNNDGISYASNTADGAFNVWGNTYPAEELPPSGTTVVVAGVPFVFPSKEDGRRNNVVCVGQVVEFNDDWYDGVSVLGAAERRTEDTMVFAATEGSARRAWLRLSDWWPEARSHFGNRLAFRCSRLHYPRHVQGNMAPALWVHRQRFRPVRTRAVALPDNPALHVFALTLRRACR